MTKVTVWKIKKFHQDEKKAEVIPKEEKLNGNKTQVRLKPFGIHKGNTES